AELRHELPITYDGRQRGTLVVFRTPQQIAAAEKDIAVLRRNQIPHQLLDREACIRAEPALAHVRDKVAGGLSLPGDETGDCHKFTQSLASACRELGVNFMLNTRIEGLVTKGQNIESVQTSAGELQADAYVMALGSYSPLMLAPLGIHLPVYPLKGYSLTMPVQDESRSPISTVMDESSKVAVTRFDDRIRVGGIAEIASYNTQLDLKRRLTIEHSVRDLFPGAGDVDKATFWTGLRPMTPDSVPVLGPTTFKNLWLNTGHGTLGWTMSLGSARFVSDLISGRSPDIDPAGLSLARYH
ncbi:MAG: D-amino acid dehydrogenase, partial [Oleibacter sp.]|nr:D-amino acid dehydrogenase [Thalassolituus sp.]